MKRSNYTKSNRRPSTKSSKGQYKGKVDDTKRDDLNNDPSWYTVSGQLVKDAASINFNNPAGIVYTLNNHPTYGPFVGPGVMGLYMAPVAGYSEGLSSPVNIAAKNLYGFVRHANSGHTNYDSPDLILYLVSMASAYAYYAWMIRIYGTLRVYSQTNRYFGLNLVKAMGVDGNDIVSNLANFRCYINQYAVKLSALSVPKTMSLYQRYMWMFSNIFLDENDAKAQMYMYQPAYLYKYDEYNGAGRCVPVPLTIDAQGNLPTTGMTYGNIMAYGDSLIAALIGSEDINVMSGDILKAYGPEGIWRLNLINEDFAIAPVFSEEVLSQIHNTVFAGSNPLVSSATPLTDGWDSFAITQDASIGPGCLVCKPLVRYGGSTCDRHVLDFWKQDVSPEDVMVATRNMVCGRRWSQGFTAIESFGSEIPMFGIVWGLKADGTLDYRRYWSVDDQDIVDTNFGTPSNTLSIYSKLQFFNEHPQFYLVKYDSTTAPYCWVNAATSSGEMSNYTILDETDLEKMHLTAILSELAVPMLGNIVRG